METGTDVIDKKCKTLNKLILSSLLLLAMLGAKAQFIEFGAGVGMSHYTGDLNAAPRFSHTHLGGTGIFRLNLSEIISLKFALTAGGLSGDDSKPIDALGEIRDYSFDHSFVELSSVFEYHFLNYRSDNRYIRWSPYAFLGLGFMRLNNAEPAYEDFSRFQFVLPMGGGVKYMLNKRITIGLEAGARKTFFDYLDGISDNDVTIKSNYEFGNPNDDDWYFYTGINITYVLYNIPCPFPYNPNKSIMGGFKDK